MSLYRFISPSLADPIEAFNTYAGFLRRSAPSVSSVAAGLYCDDLDGLMDIATACALSPLHYFCWGASAAHVLFGETPQNWIGGRLVAGSRMLTWRESSEPPLDYDWNELPAKTFTVTFTCEAMEFGTHGETVQWLESVPPSGKIVVKVSEVYSEKHKYVYTVKIRREDLVAALRKIVTRFHFDDSVGALEFCGDAEAVRRIVASTLFQSSAYPDGVYSLGQYGSPFAVGPRSAQIPVPTCSLEGARKFVGLAWEYRKLIKEMRLAKGFVSWITAEGKATPRTGGNSCDFILFDNKFEIVIGVEQYADHDPSVRVIAAGLRRLSTAMGGKLVPFN